MKDKLVRDRSSSENGPRSKERPLSERQQMLLERVIDGESGFFDRWMAARLLERSSSAKGYFDSVRGLREVYRDGLSQERGIEGKSPISSDVLWAQLERRIEEEERTALFLGSRESSAPRAVQLLKVLKERLSGIVSFGESLSPRASLVGVATVCGLVVFVGGQVYQTSGTVGMEERSAATIQSETSPYSEGSLQMVSSELTKSIEVKSNEVEYPLTAGNFDRFSFDQFFASSPNGREQYLRGGPNVVSRREPALPQLVASVSAPSRAPIAGRQAVEVDWMRSDGRVRILNSPQASAPVIFVKKRSYRSQVPQQAVPVERNSNNIVIQEPSLPTTNYAR